MIKNCSFLVLYINTHAYCMYVYTSLCICSVCIYACIYVCVYNSAWHKSTLPITHSVRADCGRAGHATFEVIAVIRAELRVCLSCAFPVSILTFLPPQSREANNISVPVNLNKSPPDSHAATSKYVLQCLRII